LWIATSAQRPRGPLLDQAVPVLAALLQAQLGARAAPGGTAADNARRARPARQRPGRP
jgi:hypothetical protein